MKYLLLLLFVGGCCTVPKKAGLEGFSVGDCFVLSPEYLSKMSREEQQYVKDHNVYYMLTDIRGGIYITVSVDGEFINIDNASAYALEENFVKRECP